MSDFVTHDELNRILQSLQLVGDQQTIRVTPGPGGQLIEAIASLSSGDSTKDSGITITYDSDLKQWTVTVSYPYYQVNGPFENANALRNVSDTLKFNNSISASSADASICIEGNSVFWYVSAGVPNSILTGVDLSTKLKERRNPRGEVFKVRFNKDGSFIIWRSDPNDAITAFDEFPGINRIQQQLNPVLSVTGSSGSTRVQLTNGWAPFDTVNDRWETPVLTFPIDTTIIMGWNDGDTTINLDTLPNAGDYDNTLTVGTIKGIVTDGSDHVTELTMTQRTPMQFTGLTQTIQFVDGAAISQSQHELKFVNGILVEYTKTQI